MLTSTELRKGTVFIHEDNPQLVLDYKHVKSARGGATIRVKVKNLKDGVVKDVTLNNGAKVEEAEIQRKTFNFLYKDDHNAYLMDNSTYDQIDIPLSMFDGSDKFLKDGIEILVTFFDGSPLSPQLPLKLAFKVIYTEPGFAGDTSTTVYKDAEIETGAIVKVPLFIKQQEVVIINTQTGEYVSRG
jgi:elongation factor P